MRAVTDGTSHVLQVVERGTQLKSVQITTTRKDENCSAAFVKAPPTKVSPVSINEGTLSKRQQMWKNVRSHSKWVTTT